MKHLAKDVNVVVISFQRTVKTIDTAVTLIEKQNNDDPVIVAQLEILKKELAHFQLERLPTDTKVGQIPICCRVKNYFQKS